jgi:hypothetical protein
MTEQLGLEQLLGDRAAVHGDEHPIRPPAVVVEGSSDQLLAGPALAGHQHGAVGVCDPLDDVEDALEPRGIADDPVEAVAGAKLRLEQTVLALESTVLDGLLDQTADHVEWALVEGLLEVPEGTRVQRLDGALRAAIAGDHDAGEVRIHVVDLPDEFEPGNPRHLDVAEHEVKGLGRHERHRLAGVACSAHLMAGSREDPLQGAPVELLVVDDQDVGLLQG